MVLSVWFGVFCVVGTALYWVIESYASRRRALDEAGKTDTIVLD